MVLVVLRGALWLGQRAYRRTFRESMQRSVEQAREAIDRDEVRPAMATLRNVLARDPTNVEATRLMARLASVFRTPEALE